MQGATAVDGNTVHVTWRYTHHVWAYDPKEDKWTGLPDCPQRHFGSAMVNGLLTAVGGRTDDGDATIILFSNNSATSSLSQQQWLASETAEEKEAKQDSKSASPLVNYAILVYMYIKWNIRTHRHYPSLRTINELLAYHRTHAHSSIWLLSSNSTRWHTGGDRGCHWSETMWCCWSSISCVVHTSLDYNHHATVMYRSFCIFYVMLCEFWQSCTLTICGIMKLWIWQYCTSEKLVWKHFSVFHK